MNTEILSRVIVFVLVAFLAALLSRRMVAPRQGWVWVVWLVLLVIAPYVGVSAKLIDIQGLAIHFNNVYQGFIFGLLTGWLLKKQTIT
jgi:hypothetical protein